MHEKVGKSARVQPHVQSYGAHMPGEYGEPAHTGMEAEYTGFKRPRQLATQQSETAEEFRFMLPEQSQVSVTPHVQLWSSFLSTERSHKVHGQES
jgi:hypothetical protein